MKKRKLKFKVLEFIILITIFLSFIIITLFMTNVLNEKPELSNSNETENYSITSYYSYNLPIASASIYNIPLLEFAGQNQTFEMNIQSTDNIITAYQEVITIQYLYTVYTYKNTIINYCNAHNDINSKYELTCTYKNNKLTLKNLYKVQYIYKEPLETNNYKIDLRIKKDTRLNEYLYQLSKNNIKYNNIQSLK